MLVSVVSSIYTFWNYGVLMAHCVCFCHVVAGSVWSGLVPFAGFACRQSGYWPRHTASPGLRCHHSVWLEVVSVEIVVLKRNKKQGDPSSGKPGDVGEFDISRGKILSEKTVYW